jgi:hypothetical protein
MQYFQAHIEVQSSERSAAVTVCVIVNFRFISVSNGVDMKECYAV